MAILLCWQAAMPALAAAAARWQGQPLVEVCTVYGVRLMPAPVAALGTMAWASSASSPAASDAPRHAGQARPQESSPADENASGAAVSWAHHCPLSLLGLAPPPAAPPASVPCAARGAEAPAGLPPAPHDAERAWMAGRQQGPPRV